VLLEDVVDRVSPMGQMEPMKQQVVMMVTQYGVIMWVQAFFVGFLVVKVPFALTERFKALTQQGIGVASLDTAYVSSMSWYVTAMSGLPRVLALFSSGSSK
jgi:hypothetical protein